MRRFELPPDVVDTGSVLRDEIEELLLERERDDEPLRAACLREAHAALTRFLARDAADESMVGDLDAARSEIASALEAVGEGDEDARAPLEEIAGMLTALRARAIGMVATTPAHDGADVAAPFRASRGVPSIHEAPNVPAPEVLDLPRPWDADPPEVDTSRRVERAKPSAIEDELARLARDALEDIGIFGNLRRLEPEEPWIDARDFEARLLANLDALWSLDRCDLSEWPRAGVPAIAWRYLTEWPTPDDGRAFAFAFALACTQSNAALRWVLLGLRRAPSSTYRSFVDALALASSPGVDGAVREILSDASSPVAAVALEIVHRRRAFAAGAVAPLLAHPDVDVVLAAIRCVRHAPAPLAIEMLAAVREDARGEVEVTALRELCAHGDASARRGLRQVLDAAGAGRRPESEGREAFRALALLGDPADHERVLWAAFAYPELTHLLGHYGAPAHLDALLGALAKARDAVTDRGRLLRLEAAVRRFTGLEPKGTFEALRAAAAERMGGAPPARVRFGQPFARGHVIDELRAAKTRQGDRRDLALELALNWPDLPRIDVETWVAQQEADLAALPRK